MTAVWIELTVITAVGLLLFAVIFLAYKWGRVAEQSDHVTKQAAADRAATYEHQKKLDELEQKSGADLDKRLRDSLQ